MTAASPHQLWVSLLIIFNAVREGFKVLPSVNDGHHKHACRFQSINDAVAVDKPLAYGSVADFGDRASHFRKPGDALDGFDDL